MNQHDLRLTIFFKRDSRILLTYVTAANATVIMSYTVNC